MGLFWGMGGGRGRDSKDNHLHLRNLCSSQQVCQVLTVAVVVLATGATFRIQNSPHERTAPTIDCARSPPSIEEYKISYHVIEILVSKQPDGPCATCSFRRVLTIFFSLSP